MKILFLLPPSEGKNKDMEWKSSFSTENLSFKFEKPLNIACNVTEKDLKCSWKRFEEWLEFNKILCKDSRSAIPTMKAINRYSWVMFNAIDYSWMTNPWKEFFEQQFLILSGMYGILKPLDTIWNYKLPIESKWLLDFWEDKIIREINKQWVDYVVNLLPISYSKLILWKNKKVWEEFNKLRKFWIININFLKLDWKKISHWVKKIKWEWVKNICEKAIENYDKFWGEVVDRKEGIIDVNIIG